MSRFKSRMKIRKYHRFMRATHAFGAKGWAHKYVCGGASIWGRLDYVFKIPHLKLRQRIRRCHTTNTGEPK